MLELGEDSEAAPVELADPALGNLVNRDRVEVMQFFAPAPHDGDEVGRLQQTQVLADGLARHREVLAQLAERLSVSRMQLVQQLPAGGIGQGPEHIVHVGLGGHGRIMQPLGCLSRGRGQAVAPT